MYMINWQTREFASEPLRARHLAAIPHKIEPAYFCFFPQRPFRRRRRQRHLSCSPALQSVHSPPTPVHSLPLLQGTQKLLSSALAEALDNHYPSFSSLTPSSLL